MTFLLVSFTLVKYFRLNKYKTQPRLATVLNFYAWSVLKPLLFVTAYGLMLKEEKKYEDK